MKLLNSLVILVMLAVPVMAEIVTKDVPYMHDGVELSGYVAYDNEVSGSRPAVLVVHEWTGLNEYAKSRCKQLAEMGYLAFAVDMYGKGIRPQNNNEAAEQAAIYRSDRPLMRARVQAGLDVLKANELCDTDRIAAIGYCFGGGVALELARSGADINGVVSFHGNLDTPDPSIARNIKGKLLVCHGAIDPFVKPEQIEGFFKEMNDARVDYQFIAYSGAVHAFTNPGSGDDPSVGAAYNANADHRSWKHMQDFFEEIFQ